MEEHERPENIEPGGVLGRSCAPIGVGFYDCIQFATAMNLITPFHIISIDTGLMRSPQEAPNHNPDTIITQSIIPLQSWCNPGILVQSENTVHHSKFHPILNSTRPTITGCNSGLIQSCSLSPLLQKCCQSGLHQIH